MKVIATVAGYDNIKVREPGEEFDVPDNYFEKRPGPCWFEPVDPKLKKKYEDRAYEGTGDGLFETNGTVHHTTVDPARQSAARDAEIQSAPGNRGTFAK